MSLSMKWSAITASTFVVAMVLVTSRFLGQIPVALTNCLVVVGALVLTFLELRGETTDSTMRRYVYGLAIFIFFSTLYLVVPFNVYLIRLFLISFFCFSQAKAVQGSEKSLATLWWSLALSAFLFGSLVTLFFAEPIFWYAAQRFSELVSGLVGNLMRQKALFDASASGIFISLILVLLGFVTLMLSKKGTGRWSGFLRYLAEIIFLNLVFIALLQHFYVWLQGLVSIPRFHIMDLPAALFLLDIIPLALYLKRVTFVPITISVFPLNWKKLTALTVFASGMLLMLYHQQSLEFVSSSKADGQKRIIIYGKGVFNWDKPEFGNYGMASAGMFGMFPSYLEAMGYNVRIDSALNMKNLDSADVVMVINLNENMPRMEKSELDRFVYQGGSLLVIGDHTGLAGIMDPLNDLLRFVNIRYRFDCGHWLADDWRDAFEFPAHPLFDGVRDESDISISIGASLDISPSNAMPMLFAKYGFSDIGNLLNVQDANLGNRMYDPGEKLGDIVLVATTSYGRGKVLVFGDTSTFQNDVLAYSFGFVNNVFHWLVAGEATAGTTSRLLTDFLLIVGLVLVFTVGEGIWKTTGVVLSSLLVIILYFLLTPWHPGSLNFRLVPSSAFKIAYVDDSHLNNFTEYREDAIWPVTHGLVRNSYLPFVCRRFSPLMLESSRIAFFISPEKGLSVEEIREIMVYMRGGGVVVWSVGEETSDASSSMLNQMGLGLDDIPLGPVSDSAVAARFAISPVKIVMKNYSYGNTVSTVDSSGMVPEFHSAWPIVATRGGDIDTLCTGWGYPVIVSKPVGKGKFVLISDSGFLLSGNLEGKTTKPYDQPIPGSNEMVFRGLLERIMEK